jgi:hypothetical protein
MSVAFKRPAGAALYARVLDACRGARSPRRAAYPDRSAPPTSAAYGKKSRSCATWVARPKHGPPLVVTRAQRRVKQGGS